MCRSLWFCVFVSLAFFTVPAQLHLCQLHLLPTDQPAFRQNLYQQYCCTATTSAASNSDDDGVVVVESEVLEFLRNSCRNMDISNKYYW